MAWHIEYYESTTGRFPVEELICSLDTKSRARVARTLDLLEEFGINLGMPYAKHLVKQLWELRIRHGKNRYRIIYFLNTEQSFILLHGFIKKTGRVLKADMEIAKTRRDDYLSRR